VDEHAAPADFEGAKPTAPTAKRRWLRPLLYGLGGVGAIAALVSALRPQPIAVDVATVEVGPLQVTIDAEGKTRVRDRFVVDAQVDGQLQRITLDPGDQVQQGEQVAQIDPLPYTSQVQDAQARLQELQAQITGVETQRPKTAALNQARARIRSAQAAEREAQAQVAQAEASLTQAQRDRERFADLQQAGAIAQQALETAELTETTRAEALDVANQTLQKAIADVAAAQDALAILQAEQQDPDYLVEVYQAQIEATRAQLANLTDTAQRTTVTAPATGEVLRILKESEGYVAAGTPLLEIGEPQSLELVIDILSQDAVQVQPGDPVLVQQWGGDQTLPAQIEYVEPSAFTEVSALGVEEQRVNAIAAFSESDIPLGDGFRVEASIVTWQAADALQVPVSALFRCEQTEWCVFTVAAGEAQRQLVNLGPRSDTAAVVEAGLAAGDHVIIHPSEQIQTGSNVEPRSPSS
ncbi:MAG: efflux RND transporter periplasmic adaptor subunit, partial [Cyanobacteria bacterium P01_H01_bin.121]